jgi:hypothetical protein
MTIVFAEAANPVDFDAAVGELIAQQVDAIFPVGGSPLDYKLRAPLFELANQQRLPVISSNLRVAEAVHS